MGRRWKEHHPHVTPHQVQVLTQVQPWARSKPLVVLEERSERTWPRFEVRSWPRLAFTERGDWFDLPELAQIP